MLQSLRAPKELETPPENPVPEIEGRFVQALQIHQLLQTQPQMSHDFESPRRL